MVILWISFICIGINHSDLPQVHSLFSHLPELRNFLLPTPLHRPQSGDRWQKVESSSLFQHVTVRQQDLFLPSYGVYLGRFWQQQLFSLFLYRWRRNRLGSDMSDFLKQVPHGRIKALNSKKSQRKYSWLHAPLKPLSKHFEGLQCARYCTSFKQTFEQILQDHRQDSGGWWEAISDGGRWGQTGYSVYWRGAILVGQWKSKRNQ